MGTSVGDDGGDGPATDDGEEGADGEGSDDASDAEAGDRDAGSASCEDPSQCDPYDCGPDLIECGDGFVVPLCINGNCGPRLTHCMRVGDLPPMSCAEMCAAQDAVCSANACRDATAYAWSDVDIQGSACQQYAVEASYATKIIGDCEDPIDLSNPDFFFVRCCCDYPW